MPRAWVPTAITDTIPQRHVGRLKKDVLHPLNMAMHQWVFDDVGRFDERLGVGSAFPSAEDNDFCFRLLCAGYSVDLCTEMVVTHRAWRDHPHCSSADVSPSPRPWTAPERLPA